MQRNNLFYLCVLAKIVESGDMELELFGLGKLSKADTKASEVIASDILSLLQDILTKKR